MGLTFEFIHNGEVLATSPEINDASEKEKINAEIKIAGDEDFRDEIENALNTIKITKTGAQLLNTIFKELNSRKIELIIHERDKSAANTDKEPYLLGFNIKTNTYSSSNGRGDGKELYAPVSTTLAHELEHIRQKLLEDTKKMEFYCIDKIPDEGSIYETIPYCEVLAVEVENAVREELNSIQIQSYDILIESLESYDNVFEEWNEVRTNELHSSLLLPRTYYGNVEVYKEKGKKFKTLSNEKQEVGVNGVKGITVEGKKYTHKRLSKEEEVGRIGTEDRGDYDIWARLLIETDKPNVTFSTSKTIKLDYSRDKKLEYRIERHDGEIVIPKNQDITIVKCV